MASRLAVLIVSLIACGTVQAQSGRGTMKGYVSLDDAAPTQPVRAHVHMAITRPGDKVAYDTYELPAVMMGEYRLTVSAPGYKSYATTLYLPSDFLGSLAVILKKDKHSRKGDAK